MRCELVSGCFHMPLIYYPYGLLSGIHCLPRVWIPCSLVRKLEHTGSSSMSSMIHFLIFKPYTVLPIQPTLGT